MLHIGGAKMQKTLPSQGYHVWHQDWQTSDAKYATRMLVGMVDTVFADVAQPDQARIVAINSEYFLKTGGHFVISIKANCIDSTVPAEAVFASEVKKLKAAQLRPKEQLTLEPYERDHAVVIGEYRTKKRKKSKSDVLKI